MHFRIVILLAIFMMNPPVLANIKTEPISIGTKITFKSEALNENRNLRVYIPGNTPSTKALQVIYLFDAEYLFTQPVGIVESLIGSHKIPPTMNVGVDSVNRSRDYLPPINGEAKSNQQRWIKSKFPEFGETKAFSTFLVSELFPFIESNYSVLPNRTIIGYSNSGVFGLHTLVNSPKTFTNYLLISPAAWWGENELDEKIDAFSQTNPEYRGNLFLSVAGEGQGMYANALRVAAKLETSAPKSLNWSLKQFEQETHQSTIHPSIYQGLVELYKDVNFNVTESVGKYATI